MRQFIIPPMLLVLALGAPAAAVALADECGDFRAKLVAEDAVQQSFNEAAYSPTATHEEKVAIGNALDAALDARVDAERDVLLFLATIDAGTIQVLLRLSDSREALSDVSTAIMRTGNPALDDLWWRVGEAKKKILAIYHDIILLACQQEMAKAGG